MQMNCITVCVLLLAISALYVDATAGTLIGTSTAMNTSYQNGYCWCKSSSTVTATNRFCTPQCNQEYTCNNNGQCLTDGSQGCQCNPGFAPPWCNACLPNYNSSHWLPIANNSNKITCDVCASGWYGQNCNVQCSNGTATCLHGTCDKNGYCSCSVGYAGGYCDLCDVASGYYPSADAPGTCRMCRTDLNCSNTHISEGYNTGDCQAQTTPGGSYCVCYWPYTGANCSACVNKNQTWPDCGVPAEMGAAQATTGQCPKPDLLVPVIIGLLLSLLAIIIVVALYFWYLKKKDGFNRNKSGRTNDFDMEHDGGDDEVGMPSSKVARYDRL